LPGVQQAAVPVLTGPRAVVRDPAYDLELFTQNPDTQQAIASVRKVMVLIVALEAVDAGLVSLDDIVTVSAAAAGTAGSSMGLVAGEQMALRDLMYGMMMVSAGDATWAISEHVAGSVGNMIAMMNAKAIELGLANTVYCHDVTDTGFSSVGYSTARDQAALWAAVSANPTFLEIAGRSIATLCGTLPDDSVLCHPDPGPMTKTMTQYLELDGWKNGNGGGKCAAYAALPGCSDCLSSQATRLDRSLVASGLRSNGSGAAWSDTTKLFDYGYRQIFTPDLRGDSGAQGGPSTDFGLDAISDTHVMTAVLPGGAALRVCHWALDVGLGSLAKLTCTDHAIAGLTAGGTPAIPRRVAIVRVSTVEAEADYVVGRVTAGALKLTAWRTGQKDF